MIRSLPVVACLLFALALPLAAAPPIIVTPKARVDRAGKARLSVAPASAADPVALGANDPSVATTSLLSTTLSTYTTGAGTAAGLVSWHSTRGLTDAGAAQEATTTVRGLLSATDKTWLSTNTDGGGGGVAGSGLAWQLSQWADPSTLGSANAATPATYGRVTLLEADTISPTSAKTLYFGHASTGNYKLLPKMDKGHSFGSFVNRWQEGYFNYVWVNILMPDEFYGSVECRSDFYPDTTRSLGWNIPGFRWVLNADSGTIAGDLYIGGALAMTSATVSTLLANPITISSTQVAVPVPGFSAIAEYPAAITDTASSFLFNTPVNATYSTTDTTAVIRLALASTDDTTDTTVVITISGKQMAPGIQHDAAQDFDGLTEPALHQVVALHARDISQAQIPWPGFDITAQYLALSVSRLGADPSDVCTVPIRLISAQIAFKVTHAQ